MSSKIVFVTGTDTGVGKTLLTAMLLHHLRQAGRRALAMKPFCSGGRGDVELLQSLQPGELDDATVNPFYFAEPVAPVAARGARNVTMAQTAGSIRRVANICDILLVEGSGGLLVPLGRGYLVADLIRRLRCEIVVVARNRLGTINHTLLTMWALRAAGLKPAAVILMSGATSDPSVRTNRDVLERLLKKTPLLPIPYLGRGVARAEGVKRAAKKVRSVLENLVEALQLR
jgi:dethiobiotin synthetase